MFSKLTLGTDRLASVNGGISDDQCRELFNAARDLGIRWLDTADSYASGDSERMIGRLGQDFSVVTKVGYGYGALPGALRMVNQVIKKLLHTLGARQSFEPAYVRKCALRSCARLNRNRLDLFLLHNPPASALTKSLLSGLDKLVSDGVVAAFGLSSPDRQVLRLGLEMGGFSVLQTIVNPSSAPAISEVLHAAQNRGIPVMAHGVAHEGGRADAFRFALSQPAVATVLTGTRSPQHLRENFAALA